MIETGFDELKHIYEIKSLELEFELPDKIRFINTQILRTQKLSRNLNIYEEGLIIQGLTIIWS